MRKKMEDQIIKLTGEDKLYFYDAAAPIVEKDSIDMNVAFEGDRYEQERGKDESETEWRKRISNQKNTGNTPYIKLDTLSEMKIVNPPLEIQNNIIKISVTHSTNLI